MEPTVAAVPKKRELSNSMWCLDTSGRLGMIAEINGGVATFHYEKQTLAEGEAPCLESAPKYLDISELTQAGEQDLPTRLAYTPQQLVDLGYL